MRWLYAIALIAVFVWGLEQVAVSPLETGDVYPPYSSLRSDPLGAKALFESLAALPGLKVDRLYKQRTALDGPAEAMFVLGVDPVSFSSVNDKELQAYEALVQGGGRLVIGFLPVRRGTQRSGHREIEQRWHVKLEYVPGSDATSSAVPRDTALFFTAATEEWRRLEGHNAIERTFGRGSIVLAADTFALSNEGLRDARDPAFVAALAGPATHILFDENHFGVVETGSVTTLMRKYHLEGAVAMLALAAALFLWRSGSSFLPARETRGDAAVAGRDSMEGMTALLVRGVPEKNLLNACFAEWSRSAGREARAPEIEDEIRKKRDPVEGYRAACRALANKEIRK
jgi:hypothetical protein